MVDIKDSFKIGSKCVVSQDSDLRGDITIGSGTILHPRCTLLAMSGPIVLGANCIVEENVVILNRSKSPMMIGDHNLFQVASRIESPSVGSYNVFGIKSRVAHGVTVGSHCDIGAGRRIWTGEGEGQNRALHAKHLAYLGETLPKFHKLKVFA